MAEVMRRYSSPHLTELASAAIVGTDEIQADQTRIGSFRDETREGVQFLPARWEQWAPNSDALLSM